MRICEQFQVAVMIGRPEKNVRNGNGIQVTTQHVFRVINITGLVNRNQNQSQRMWASYIFLFQRRRQKTNLLPAEHLLLRR
jgi:hypothetical protein